MAGMVIQHNMNAIGANNKMNVNVQGTKKATEKLSSGYQINRAGDNAAGLAISEKMRSQIRGLSQATKNANDGISMIQTFEGALQESHSILQRMKELASQSANGTYQNQVDRDAIQAEFNQLNDELDQISDTDFNGVTALNGGKMADGVEQNGGTITYDPANPPSTEAIDTAKAAVEAAQEPYDTAKEELAKFKSDCKEATDDEKPMYEVEEVDGEKVFKEDALHNKIETDAYKTAKSTFSDAAKDLNSAIKDLAKAQGVSVSNSNKAATAGLTYTSDITLQVGARTKDSVNFTFTYDAAGMGDLKADLDCSSRGLGTDILDLKSQETANDAIDKIDNAINKVSMVRANFGAMQNRLEHKVENLTTTNENLTAAESQIRDTDMASEMINYTKNNILQQASQAMLAQANQQPQSVLQLLG